MFYGVFDASFVDILLVITLNLNLHPPTYDFIFVSIGCMPNFSLLDYIEDGILERCLILVPRQLLRGVIGCLCNIEGPFKEVES